ncbi:sulfatase-like hydrolase/transferase [Lysobacter enzymogenes]|uniref:sulfatase-like hydrolase/transferase n=1 Tax=Lysobacter enzymogenes TaxID=69 RepID=UPI0038508946
MFKPLPDPTLSISAWPATRRRKFAHLLLATAAATALLLLDDRLQQWFGSDGNDARLQPAWVAALAALSAGLWLGGRRWAANAVLGLFALMQLCQLSHIAAIGRPLTPLDVAMIPRELHDILGAGRAEFGAHWPTLFAGAIPYALLFALYNLGLRRLPLPRTRWALLAVAALLAWQPYKASRQSMVRFLPQAGHSSLANALRAFSYSAVNLTGVRIHDAAAPYRPYRIQAAPVAAPPQAIWLVIFDSTRLDRWSPAGPARDTTPNLSGWIDRGQAHWHRGIAGAVATRASLTLLLNGVREPGHLRQLRSHESNLFRLAKRAGYRTYWLSTQYGGDLLQELDARSIDVARSREDAAAAVQARGDDAIFAQLDAAAPARGERRLMVLLLRTAHLPFEDAYRRHGARYRRWPDSAAAGALDAGHARRNAYDNAIAYQDDLIARLYRRFETMGERGLFVVTSDHGQMLGEDGVWGHNVLTPHVAQVPMLVRTRGAGQTPLAGNGEWLAHHQLFLALAARLGYRIDNPNAVPGRYFLQGSDVFGDNLYREARATGTQLQLGAPTALRHGR